MRPFLRSLGAVFAGLVAAAIVTAVLLAGGIANMIMLPHPLWVWVAAIAAFLVGGHAGSLIAMRSSRR